MNNDRKEFKEHPKELKELLKDLLKEWKGLFLNKEKSKQQENNQAKVISTST